MTNGFVKLFSLGKFLKNINLLNICTNTNLWNNILDKLFFCLDQGESTSSEELSYSEDFRRKILEILSDSTDNPDRMKKLFEAVIEAKGRG